MAETGLNQNWNRDYDPMVGRYIESDPVGLAGGSYSTYAYCNANPLARTDLSGQAFVDCAAALAELEKATIQVEIRLTDIAATIACGRTPDAGHIKALQQAVNRLEKAYKLVNDHCGNYTGAVAALAAAAAALVAAAAYLAVAVVANMKRSSQGKPEDVSAIQASMVDAVRSVFGASQLEDLRVVIRLTVEFRKSVEGNNVTNYVAASVFSGLDSFLSLVHGYGVLKGAEKRSQLQWKAVSIPSLTREFQSLYSDFIAEEKFEKRCRLLLDLFKLELVLAAMTYDCDKD
jgi:hypothetical protein